MRDQRPTVFVVHNDAAALKRLEALLQSVRLRTEIYLSAEDFFCPYDPARPGCLILGVRMPGMSGLHVYRRLREEGNDIPVIFFTRYGDITTAVTAMREGAFDFLEMPYNDQYLLDRVQAAIAQDGQDRERRSEQKAIAVRFMALSPRECEIVHCLMQGRTSKAIACELGVSLKTVDFHRANIMRKMGAETVAHLVRLLLQGGYVKDHRPARTPCASLVAV